MNRQCRNWVAATLTVTTGCASAVPEGDAGSDVGGVWQRCCSLFPGTISRGSGSYMECFCTQVGVCNYIQTCYPHDVQDAGARDAGALDVGLLDDDAGFAEAGPIEDADALITADALVSNDVAFAERGDAP